VLESEIHTWLEIIFLGLLFIDVLFGFLGGRFDIRDLGNQTKILENHLEIH
jgi:hypothetical protein